MNVRRTFAILSLIFLITSLTLHAQDTVHTYPQVPNPEGAPPDFIPVEKEPQVVKQAIPMYPALAVRAGIEGRVWVKIWVDKDGKPRRAVILKSDAEIFNQAAIDAAMRYRFSPAMLKGEPVDVWVVVPFNFKLNKDSTSVRVSKYSELPNMTWSVQKLPQIVSLEMPAYPEHAPGRKETVLVRVLVGVDGNPVKAAILQGRNTAYAKAAVSAAMKSTFTPAMSGVGPVEAWVIVPYSFEPKK